nr:uncharacterized protein LOC123773400 isoform X2 [Procambarus clarkii]XP_045623098.1 uncharacterized protein LOC123773400 isoform X2 [Procambarus clarkii]XP_045623099.1 uncharacterized protein LOC123773400 isoform X2 [Procambarus clarkii]
MNIQDACNCKVCFSDFDDQDHRARVLACGHTFCASCITDMIKNKNGTVACPNCRSEHTLTTATDLNVNYLIDEMFSEGQTDSAPAQAHGQDLVQAPVPVQAPDCHVDKPGCPKLSAGVCDDHGQYLLFKCGTCDVWICQACTVVEHPREKCSVLSIKKAIEDMKTNATNNINSQIAKCEAALAKLNSYDSELEEQVQSHHNYLISQEAVMSHCRETMSALETEQHRACKEREECYGAKQDLEALVGRIDDTFTLQEVNDCLQDTRQVEQTIDNWTKHFEDNFPNETLVSKSKKVEMMSGVVQQLVSWDATTRLQEQDLRQVVQAIKRTLLQALVKTREVYAVVEREHQMYLPLTYHDNTFIFGPVQHHLHSPQAHLMSLQELLSESGAVYAVVEEGARCSLAAQVTPTGAGYTLHPLLHSQVPPHSTKIPLLETLVGAGLVVGVEEESGRGGVASLSCLHTQPPHLLCLHVLRYHPPPPPPADSFKISYRHLHQMIGESTVEVFLELAWGGKTRGRVYMKVDVTSGRGQQFLMLCTGEGGFSYVNTKLLSVGNKGHPGEFLLGGDYENNDGSGGAALLAGIPSAPGLARPLTAGLLSGHNHSDKSSQFLIYTKDLPGCKDYLSFGKVREGLDVLVSAAALSDPREATVEDCGVIVSL